MKTATLLKHVSLYPHLKRYRCIKDIPAHEKQFAPLRLDFRLWGIWYVPKTPTGLLLADGESLPFHTMHSTDGQIVIGPRDLEAAAGTKYEQAWRESYAAKIEEWLAIHTACKQ